MEIKGVNTTLKNEYPRNNEISKKKIRKSFLSKWNKIGLTSEVILAILKNACYANLSGISSFTEDMSMMGGMALSVKKVYELDFFGTIISISEESYNTMSKAFMGLTFIMIGVLIAYLIGNGINFVLYKKKMKPSLALKIMTIAIVLLIIIDVIISKGFSPVLL